jgi:hypothetical protein
VYSYLTCSFLTSAVFI